MLMEMNFISKFVFLVQHTEGRMMRLIFWVGFLTSLALLFLTIEFSRRDKLSRNGFFIWLSISFGLAFFSLLPTVLRGLTELVGLKFTYVFASTVGIFILLFLVIYAYSQINENRERIKELTQKIALQNAESSKELKGS